MIKPTHDTVLKCERILHGKIKQAFFTTQSHVIGCVLPNDQILFVNLTEGRRVYPGQSLNEDLTPSVAPQEAEPTVEDLATEFVTGKKPRRKRRSKSGES